ncbi:hypothetical protein ZWY2020_038569 [Hordeum vulgare]|nr:hypothetical protein ZWY2020_038569 [Hordeum vulgare]
METASNARLAPIRSDKKNLRRRQKGLLDPDKMLKIMPTWRISYMFRKRRAARQENTSAERVIALKTTLT